MAGLDPTTTPCNPLEDLWWPPLDVIDWQLHRDVKRICENRRLFGRGFIDTRHPYIDTKHPDAILWFSGILPEAIKARAQLKQLVETGAIVLTARRNFQAERIRIEPMWMHDLDFCATTNSLVLVDKSGRPLYADLLFKVAMVLQALPRDWQPPPQALPPSPAVPRNRVERVAHALLAEFPGRQRPDYRVEALRLEMEGRHPELVPLTKRTLEKALKFLGWTRRK
jgi:hypothetical protein